MIRTIAVIAALSLSGVVTDAQAHSDPAPTPPPQNPRSAQICQVLVLPWLIKACLLSFDSEASPPVSP
jgi:hypothetical protein